ncbi:MAG: hypothetical protein AAFR01_02415, partial [Pseudomonadota bacterium]
PRADRLSSDTASQTMPVGTNLLRQPEPPNVVSSDTDLVQLPWSCEAAAAMAHVASQTMPETMSETVPGPASLAASLAASLGASLEVSTAAPTATATATPLAPGSDTTPLTGTTYRYRLDDDGAPLNVTINGAISRGRWAPRQLLIQTDDPGDQIWVSGFAKVATALLQRDGNVDSLAEIFSDPVSNRSRADVPPVGAEDRTTNPHNNAGDKRSAENKRVLAILGCVSHALSADAQRTADDGGRHDVFGPKPAPRHSHDHASSASTNSGPAVSSRENTGPEPKAETQPHEAAALTACPNCGDPAMIKFEGCWVCKSCGAAACS